MLQLYIYKKFQYIFVFPDAVLFIETDVDNHLYIFIILKSLVCFFTELSRLISSIIYWHKLPTSAKMLL